MRRMCFVILTVLVGFCGTAEVAVADDATNAWKALRAGGHVALMRHAEAPGGFGDQSSNSHNTPPSISISLLSFAAWTARSASTSCAMAAMVGTPNRDFTGSSMAKALRSS